jgi:hypothetical protein
LATARIHGLDYSLKETAVSNLNTTNEQNAEPQPVELLDCGQASKVTQGLPFLLSYEFCPVPFDRTFA